MKGEAEDGHERTRLRLEEAAAQGASYEGALSADEVARALDEPALRCAAARAVAELCKSDERRPEFARADVVDKLIAQLEPPLHGDSARLELAKQSCRALGNVCYESRRGRELVLARDGGMRAIAALPARTLELDEASSAAGGDELRLCACRLLLVLALGGEECARAALAAGLAARLRAVVEHELRSPRGDEERLHAALLVAGALAEHARAAIVDERLAVVAVDVLRGARNADVAEACLEYLHYQAENDEIKTALAKASLPQILWRLLQEHKTLAVDEESRELMKLTCDLIALILTGDAAMNMLYDDGNGEFYLSMVDSLNCENVELSITAILAIGNFARTDSHCMRMMDSGIFSKLMSILVSHKNQEDDIRLQHVVLSGLRNLVIPQRNKSLAVQQGILPILLEMIPNVVQYHVVFKLLATLRMLVDGQESVAEKLVTAETLDRIANWGLQTEHSGVSGEASRLLARTARQLQSPDLLIKLVQAKGCVTCLANMLAAPHAIMQNEAIVALTILSAVCFDETRSAISGGESVSALLIGELLKCDFVKQLNVMLESNAGRIQSEIAENLCKFLMVLFSDGAIKKQMIENDSIKLLRSLVADNANLSDNAKNAIDRVVGEISKVSSNGLE